MKTRHANRLAKLKREFREQAIERVYSQQLSMTACRSARSDPLRLRNGGTLFYVARLGPRGGITVSVKREVGWVLDHPADFGEPSY